MSIRRAPLVLAVAAASALPGVAQPPSPGPSSGGECVMLQAFDGSAPYVSDPAECAIKTAPASTFKIPHALIALDSGVVTDPFATVEWDGTKQPFAAWERDHSLDSAVKASNVRFFQATAASIGRERMIRYLESFDYADDEFEGELTLFWLNGDLTVSPEQQLRFLRRLVSYELPVERRHVDAVKASFLMPHGKIVNASGTHDFTLTWPEPLVVRAKTGNAVVDEERTSWVIGHIETLGMGYVFVSRVRADEALTATAGADLALRVLNARRPRE